jgi:hypothetical protein
MESRLTAHETDHLGVRHGQVRAATLSAGTWHGSGEALVEFRFSADYVCRVGPYARTKLRMTQTTRSDEGVPDDGYDGYEGSGLGEAGAVVETPL